MRLIDIMTGTASALAMLARAPAEDDGEPMSVIELEDNLGDAEKPPELPAGVYTGEVQDVQAQTSQKGNRYFAVKFVIPPDEIPADVRDGFPDGAILYWNRQIVPKAGDRRAVWNLKNFIEALGLDTNTNTIDPSEWMGATAQLRVRHRTYEGETRAEISAVEAAEKKAAAKLRGRAQAQEEVEEEATTTRQSGKQGGRGQRGRR